MTTERSPMSPSSSAIGAKTTGFGRAAAPRFRPISGACAWTVFLSVDMAMVEVGTTCAWKCKHICNKRTVCVVYFAAYIHLKAVIKPAGMSGYVSFRLVGRNQVPRDFVGLEASGGGSVLVDESQTPNLWDFSGGQPVFAFLYLIHFRSFLRLPPIFSQNGVPRFSGSCRGQPTFVFRRDVLEWTVFT